MKALSLASRMTIFLLCVFLIAFPKGGFKLGTIPVTWGYILLFMTCFASFFFMWQNGFKIYLPKARASVLLLTLPFQCYGFFILMFSTASSLGFLLSAIISLLVMPLLFLLVLNNYMDRPDFKARFIPMFRAMVLFVAAFGLLLFFYRIKTGVVIEIPYLSANIDDAGTLDTEKNNMRGDLAKLISTYNNGNIYGVCILMFLPLYMESEKKLYKRIIVVLSLVLTLSRTVWLGVIIYFLLNFSKEFLKAKTWLYLGLAVLVIGICGPIILHAMDKDVSFLFDKNLGGRANQLAILDNLTFWGDFQFNALAEIVYLSILRNFGIVGLVLFLLYIAAPVIVFYIHKKNGDPAVDINSSAWWGLIIYMIVAASDGAILLIPVMAFYWFLAAYIFAPPQPVAGNG